MTTTSIPTILFGAFDRHNFGDLLFPYIAAALLPDTPVLFAGLAAVVLPMVMDEEPKQAVQDIQIRIPGQDQKLFDPAELAARSSPSAAVAAAGAEHDAAL